MEHFGLAVDIQEREVTHPYPAIRRCTSHAGDIKVCFAVNADESCIILRDGESVEVCTKPVGGFDLVLLVILLIKHVVLSDSMASHCIVASPEGEVRLSFVLLYLKIVDLAVSFRRCPNRTSTVVEC